MLILDKPEGLSSNAALQRVRRMLRAEKAGHVGSLDPLATGMLPVCLGEATKIAGEILSARKRYRFAVQLGVRTATGDREGAVVESAAVPQPLNPSAVEPILSRFLGRQQQVPPMYSALKRDGQPLYKLARAGIEVERAPREIEVGELTLLGCEQTVLDLEVFCSKGTYVRTLAEDIARALGTCGHVIRLRRIYVEPFENEPMQSLESVENTCRAGELPRLVAADAALPHLPAVRLTAALAARVSCGQAVVHPVSHVTGRVRLYDDRDGFLGIGEVAEGSVRPRRLFVRPLVAGGGYE